MIKVLLIGASPISNNLGVPSLLISTCNVLRSSISDIEFAMFSKSISKDTVLANRYGIRVVEANFSQFTYLFIYSLIIMVFTKFEIDLRPLFKNLILEEYYNADIVIDMLGISFTDYFPSFLSYMYQSVILLIGKNLGKPVIKFTQEMGPFENKFNKFFGKITLNRLDFILARSATTKTYLEKLNIKTPIYIFPDTSFILEPASSERINEIKLSENLNQRPLIGIVASRQIDKRILKKENKGIDSQNKYTQTLARVADHLISEYRATIVLIPNEISGIDGKYDDVYVSRKVYEIIADKSQVKVISTAYEAQELKGLIKECDAIVTSRYHSTIAALSTAVPCLVIGWGFKYLQAMSLLGQEKFVIDFETMTEEETLQKLDELIKQKDRIKLELFSKIPRIKNEILSEGDLVKVLLHKYGKY